MERNAWDRLAAGLDAIGAATTPDQRRFADNPGLSPDGREVPALAASPDVIELAVVLVGQLAALDRQLAALVTQAAEVLDAIASLRGVIPQTPLRPE